MQRKWIGLQLEFRIEIRGLWHEFQIKPTLLLNLHNCFCFWREKWLPRHSRLNAVLVKSLSAYQQDLDQTLIRCIMNRTPRNPSFIINAMCRAHQCFLICIVWHLQHCISIHFGTFCPVPFLLSLRIFSSNLKSFLVVIIFKAFSAQDLINLG